MHFWTSRLRSKKSEPDVKVFLDDASNTVSKVNGRFDSNLESCIKLTGVNSSFRNSSVFSQYAADESHERRQAFPEVDALLDHLFRHVHFKLFASYIRSLVVAFRCEAYDGKSNSGGYRQFRCNSCIDSVAPLRQGPLVYSQIL